MSERSLLTIKRIHHYRDTIRGYSVRVDGQSVGVVKNDKQVSFEVEPGEHSVQVRLMWIASPTISVSLEEGQDLHLETGPNGGVLQAWRIYFAPRTAMFLRASQTT
jgi:hypothetical protein